MMNWGEVAFFVIAAATVAGLSIFAVAMLWVAGCAVRYVFTTTARWIALFALTLSISFVGIGSVRLAMDGIGLIRVMIALSDGMPPSPKTNMFQGLL